jgi:hypothetical protein
VVSSPVLNMLWSSGNGVDIICPISKVKSTFSGYTFVDDTDLVVAKLSFRSFTDAAQALQTMMTI